MTDHKVFNGSKLLTLRKGMSLSQTQLAEKLGSAPGDAARNMATRISTYETGKVQPNREIVESLAGVFGVEPEELYSTNHGEIRITVPASPKQKAPIKKRTTKKKPGPKPVSKPVNQAISNAQAVGELTASRLTAAEEAEIKKNRMTLTVIGEFFDSSTYIAQNNEGDLFKVSPLNEW